MRKMIMLMIALALVVNNTNAAFTETKTEQKEVKSTSSIDDQRNVTEFFTNLSRKDYEQLTGRHLSLLERLVLKLSQKQLRRKYDEQNPSKRFNLTGFLTGLGSGIVGALIGALILSVSILGFLWLGLLLSLVGVSLTSIFSKDKNLRKWAWRGLGTYVILSLVFIIVIIIALLTCGCLG